MEGDLEALIGDVFAMFEQHSQTVVFSFAGKPVRGEFEKVASESELTRDGKTYHVRGTLTISVRNLAVAPKLDSIITDPAGARYRIGLVESDAASWNLTLTNPNAEK